MSDLELIEREITEYLEKSDNLSHEDQRKYLRAIFDKQSQLMKLGHIVNRMDMLQMVSRSKSIFSTQTVPMFISHKKVDTSELVAVAVIEATLGYLNNKGLLNKSIKLEYTKE